MYAITSLEKSGTEWISLRKLNTQTAQFTTVILNGKDEGIGIYDPQNMRKLESFINDTIMNSHPQLAFGSGVAAIAYDKATNRVFFTPMQVDQLRYLDLNTMKIFSVTGQSFAKAGGFEFVAGTISRMVIAPNGYGYTITNDGEHLFRFTTKGEIAITDMGPLVDAPNNKELALNNPCVNAGGDIVADDEGNIFLISGSNRIFKVDVNTKNTQYLGTITGLPQGFTTNGAAADEDGNLLVSSSTYTEGYFLVKPQTWTATPYKPILEMYGTADLANSNTLHTSPTSLKIATGNFNGIKIYPNPVSNDQFNIQFNNLKAGTYTVQLTDAFGGKIVEQKVKVTQTSQTESINVSGNNASGSYFLRVLDEKNLNVYTQIVLIQRW